MQMTNDSSSLQETVEGNRLQGMWRLMHGYRLLYGAAVVGVALAALARAGMFRLLQYFVDDVLANDSLAQQVPLVAIGFVGIAVVMGTFTFISGRFAAHTAESIARTIRDFVYDHIQRLTYTYHDNMQTGELLQRATSDVDALRRLFAEQMIGVGRIVTLFLVNFGALLLLDVQLALLSVIIVPLTVGLSVFFFGKLEKAFSANQKQEARVSNKLQENLVGVRVVKAFARQAFERDSFEHENSEQLKRGNHVIFYHSLFWPITDAFSGVQMVGGFFLAAVMAINGELTVGEYIAYHGYLIQIVWPIRNLGRLVTQMSTGLVSFGRLREVIRELREPLDEGDYAPTSDLRGDLFVENVSFSYDGGDEEMVLSDITLHAEPGKTIALMGAAGSGKTSLVNLLPRFYGYTNGRILLDGIELTAYPRGYLRQQMGIVQQEPFLFSATIRDNIAYGAGRDVTDEEIFAAARDAAVHDVILSFPKGYDTLVGERGVTLSGGQKQRVTLARTLLKNPRILILDDATSSVDTETEAQIRAALQERMGSCTTFIIAHRIQSVMNADEILVLENGRVAQRGTHEQLISQSGIYQRTYRLQAQVEAELAEDLGTATPDAFDALPMAGD